MKIRGILLTFHRWFGLLGAVWLLLMGLTGAILVFYEELDHALNPDLFRASGDEVNITLDDAARTVAARYPDLQITAVWRLGEGNNWLVRGLPAPDSDQEEYYVDPATGEFAGHRNWYEITFDRAHIMPFIYAFHYSLQLGYIAEWCLGLLAFLWLLDHIAAAWLAFPKASQWGKSFLINKARRLYDVHRAAGLWLFPVTLVVAFSGAYMNWRPYFEAAIEPFSERTVWPGYERAPLDTPLLNPPLSFDDAEAIVNSPTPHGVIYLANHGVYVVRSLDTRDLTRGFGQLATVVDGNTGERRRQVHVAGGSAADVIDAWQLPLHTGKVFGWPGRIAVFLSGVALCGFVVTGLVLWARKRRYRKTNDTPLLRALRTTARKTGRNNLRDWASDG